MLRERTQGKTLFRFVPHDPSVYRYIYFFPIRHYVIKYSCLFTVERRLLTCCCYPVVICPLRDLSPKVVTLVFWWKKIYVQEDRRVEFFPRSTIYYSCRWIRWKWCARLHFTVCWFTAACASIYCQLWCTILWKAFEKVPFFNKNMKVSLRQWNLNDL